jgi:hypothetical protein
MKPNVKCCFAIEFEAHMKRLLGGWQSPNVTVNKRPSLKQLEYLKKLGCQIVPNTSSEAHVLIERYKKV